MNNNKYPHLTSPIQLGKVTFRNRIFSAPMGATDITADCCPGPLREMVYSIFPANHMRVAAGVGVAVIVAVLTVC